MLDRVVLDLRLLPFGYVLQDVPRHKFEIPWSQFQLQLMSIFSKLNYLEVRFRGQRAIEAAIISCLRVLNTFLLLILHILYHGLDMHFITHTGLIDIIHIENSHCALGSAKASLRIQLALLYPLCCLADRWWPSHCHFHILTHPLPFKQSHLVFDNSAVIDAIFLKIVQVIWCSSSVILGILSNLVTTVFTLAPLLVTYDFIDELWIPYFPFHDLIQRIDPYVMIFSFLLDARAIPAYVPTKFTIETLFLMSMAGFLFISNSDDLILTYWV